MVVESLNHLRVFFFFFLLFFSVPVSLRLQSGVPKMLVISTLLLPFSPRVGGRFKREGTYVHLWLIHVDVWQKPTQFCKAIILQLKKKKKPECLECFCCISLSPFIFFFPLISNGECLTFSGGLICLTVDLSQLPLALLSGVPSASAL